YGVDAPSVLDLDKESQKISLEISDIYSNIDAGMLSKEAGKADIEALQRRGNMLGMKDLGARQAGDRQASAADDYRALLEERRQAGADIDDAAKADFAKRGLSIKSRMGDGDAGKVLGVAEKEQDLFKPDTPKTTDALLVQMSGEIAKKTGVPRNEALAELKKPFAKMKSKTKVQL
ncbi:MAG: hypothetical protein GY938_27365, partial [Ketobacter sp.]|nr:hypothetical protein [Ketobacter sp.]